LCSSVPITMTGTILHDLTSTCTQAEGATSMLCAAEPHAATSTDLR
jgi:hypothetical protein